jgi:hypothetical protein
LPGLLKEIITVSLQKIILLLITYTILSSIFLLRLSPYVDEIIGYQQCEFDVTNLLLIRYFTFAGYWRKKNGSTTRKYVSYSLISRKPMIQSGGKYCTILLLRLGYPQIELGLIKCY